MLPVVKPKKFDPAITGAFVRAGNTKATGDGQNGPAGQSSESPRLNADRLRAAHRGGAAGPTDTLDQR
jgi:hypothetical protein